MILRRCPQKDNNGWTWTVKVCRMCWQNINAGEKNSNTLVENIQTQTRIHCHTYLMLWILVLTAQQRWLTSSRYLCAAQQFAVLLFPRVNKKKTCALELRQWIHRVYKSTFAAFQRDKSSGENTSGPVRVYQGKALWLSFPPDMYICR